MVIIKKGNFEDKGTLYLDEGKTKIRPAVQRQREEIRIESDEAPLLGPVQEKAHRIIAEAEERAREIIEESRAKGYEEGMEAGKKEGEDKVNRELKDALGTLNQAVKERKKIIKDSESEILRLALKIAEQIIRSEVSLHRDVCLNIVSEAISRVSDREQIIIRVNREDVEQVKKYKDQIGKLADGVKSLSILEDSNVEPGGCIIETNLGYVDARISTKIKSIEDTFRKVAESNEHV